MIKWRISQFGLKKKKVLLCLTDFMIAKKCFSQLIYFEEYKILIEKGTDFSKEFPTEITKELLERVDKLDWSNII